MTPSDRSTETPLELLTERRRAAGDALGDGVMVLQAAPVRLKSRDTEFPYRPDSELFYLSGATEPETVAVLLGGNEPELVLFVRSRDPEAELWAGPRLGPEEAERRFGAQACHPLSELGERLPALLGRGDRIHYRLGRDGPVQVMVLEALATARTKGARTGTGPRGIVDPGSILDELRLVKDDHELSLLRAAARLSLDGHRAGASAIAPGAGEWVVEAAIDGAFKAGGGAGPAFETIVGSGSNACVLHYVANRDVIAPDALVLVDAGVEYRRYHGDITRTFPASGRFTSAQRDIYELVEAARKAAVDIVAPGVAASDVHEVATRVMIEGLIDLGVLTGAVDDAAAESAHKPFFPHQTSHWLGLDVHDPGDYARNGTPRPLEPGMVLTVEPGLYFRPELCTDGAVPFAGIGVRIEDDVAVTAEGNEVLTGALPTTAAEVESMVGATR